MTPRERQAHRICLLEKFSIHLVPRLLAKGGETGSQPKCNQQNSDSLTFPFNAISWLAFYFIFIDGELISFQDANQPQTTCFNTEKSDSPKTT